MLVQPENAFSPIVVTLLGIVTLINPLHPANAKLPMVITLSGIVTLVRIVYLKNAEASMLVTGFSLIFEGIYIFPL